YSAIDADGGERVGIAESSDLVLWKKHKNNPVLDVSSNAWDKVSAVRGDIKKIKDKLYIFYSGRNRHFYKIGMAELFISNE
ncbi:MAG: hypothetical protein Q7K55_01520, partial [Candidatus Levybacteria bacterium]|nr:hypothetical protein [Candidatus Levybacteria bacterium]